MNSASIVLLLIIPALAQTAPPAPQDFIAEFTNVKVSPDGEHVATIRPFNGRSALVIYRFDQTPAEGAQEVFAIPSGDDVEISGYLWASNDRLLIQAGFSFENLQSWHERFDEFEGTQLIAVGLDGSDPLVLGPYGVGSVAHPLPNDPDHVIIRTRAYRGREVYRVNTRTGQHTEIRPGRRETGTMYVDDTQRIRVVSRHPREEYELFWRPARGTWRRLIHQSREDGERIGAYGIYNGGEDIYMYSNHEGRRGVYMVRPVEGNAMQPVFLDGQYDAGSIGRNRLTDQPTYVAYTADIAQRHYLDASVEELDTSANRALPGAYAFSSSFSSDRTRVEFRTGGPGNPPQTYLYDAATGQYRLFAPMFPLLRDEQMAHVDTVAYQARDGLTIHGYLATPSGLGDGPHPVIVLPHGGPAARDSMNFDVLRQFFATRGYVVFQPNYRGSTGYGNDFYQAGWGEWGRGMQDDISDGVRFLVREGIADPDRICIAGWSYGAYAALLGVATTPNLYRCAIGINGVYDVEQLRDPRNLRYVDAVAIDWEKYLGDDIYNLSAQRSISPRYLADDITAPVLIIGAAQDLQARMAHSEDMIAALVAAGVPHESRLFEAGGHSLNFGPSREETFRLIDTFLATHLR